MPIELPENRKEIFDRMKNDVRAAVPKSNPFLRNSVIKGFIFGISGRVFDFFSQIKVLLDELFMDTATGDFLARWGSYKAVFKEAATTAEGPITIGGTPGSVIPDGTDFQTQDQTLYTSNGVFIISDFGRALISLNASLQTVTAITASPHEFASGITVDIVGADQPEYNGSFTIQVLSDDTFTYVIEGTPTSPATGAFLDVLFDGATVNVLSQDFGTVANQSSGTALTLTTPIAGVDNAGFVQPASISGGEDIEDEDDFRNRIIDVYQNPVSFFNVAQIEQKVRTVAGITRVFVREITPVPGAITVYFTKDNDPSIIPSLTDRRLAKEAVLEIKPGHVRAGTPADPDGLDDPNSGDIHFPIVTSKLINFQFSTLVPDTPSMREAINANLDQVFRQDNPVGNNADTIASTIFQFVYDCAIFESFDDAGNKVQSFVLVQPFGNIITDEGEIAIFDPNNTVFP